MSKEIEFGVLYQSYGKVYVDVPDDICTREDAIKYLNEHWSDIPLPVDAEYVEGSDKIDEDGDIFLDGKEI